MVSCAKCKLTAGEESKKAGISFHRFPKNEYIRKKWVTFVRSKIEPKPNSRLCSQHFHASCYDQDSFAYVKLFPQAVPTINNGISCLEGPSQGANIMENVATIKQEGSSLGDIIQNVATIKHEPTLSYLRSYTSVLADTPSSKNIGKAHNMECKFCCKSYHSEDSLKLHMRRCIKNPKIKPFSCSNCLKSFSRKNNCDAHVIRNACTGESNKHCHIDGCNFTYYFKTSLLDHLKNVHKMDTKPVENYKFRSELDFQIWKDEMEERTYSYYSLHCGRRKGYVYYYCQHDGSSKRHISNSERSGDQSKKKRNPRSKGRIKTGAVCTSMIKVSIEDNCHIVKFFPTHCHPIDINDLKHQPLSFKSNLYINNQIRRGVSPKKIINALSGDKLNLSRNDFILVKRLRERRRKLMASPVSQDSEDAAENSQDSNDGSLSLLLKCYAKEKIGKIIAEIVERVNDEQFPEHLLPRVTDVLTKLLSECHSALDDDEKSSPNTVTTTPTPIERTPTKMLTCQVFPLKRKPKMIEYSREEDTFKIYDTVEEMSAEDLDKLIIEVEEE